MKRVFVPLMCVLCISAQNYRSPEAAAAGAHDAVAKMRSAVTFLETSKLELPRLNAQLRRLADEIANLKAVKDSAIEELRKGFYCSQCHRTKTEIEHETGRPFFDHLREVNGQPVPASQSEINAKEAEFDRQISTKQQQADAISNNVVRINSARIQNQKIVSDNLLAYQSAINAEDKLLEERQNSEHQQDQTRIQSIQSKIAETEKLYRAAFALESAKELASSNSRARELYAILEVLRSTLAEAGAQATAHEREHEFERGAFEGRKRATFVEVQQLMARFDGPMLMSPAYGLIPYGQPVQLKGGGFTGKFSADQIQVSRGPMQLQMSDDFFKQEQNVKACLEFMGLQGCMGRTTTWKSDGRITTEDAPALSSPYKVQSQDNKHH